jgi:methylenetetrahydrofolate--tRNA-(uracil-5-)-methyltransferase
VDREAFARRVTEEITSHPRITLERREVIALPERPCILATGPLTSPALHRSLDELLGEGALSFYDAIAPIVADDSIDQERLFRASRYGKGGDDYLNIPLDREAYERFVDALLAAEKTAFRDFETEDIDYFEGCLPIEVMAERGRETLRYGPMKPVGLTDPATGTQPWAVVQLRQDDIAADHWNMVGFQTKLTHAEQKRVFRTLPGMERARFVRLGLIHRNTFINAPAHLDDLLRVVHAPHIRLAGQMTGVEGYVESAATGLMAARSLAAEHFGSVPPSPPPPTTAHGGLIRHLTARSSRDFQPANITWGLISCPPELRSIRRKRERRQAQAEWALRQIASWGASPM